MGKKHGAKKHGGKQLMQAGAGVSTPQEAGLGPKPSLAGVTLAETPGPGSASAGAARLPGAPKLPGAMA
jgi:hypothetical protein